MDKVNKSNQKTCLDLNIGASFWLSMIKWILWFKDFSKGWLYEKTSRFKAKPKIYR